MGGGSKSSSSQQTTTTNQSQQVGLEGDNGVIFNGVDGGIDVESLDARTVEEAFNAITEQNTQIFDFATSFFDKAVSTTQNAVSDSYQKSADLTKELFEEKNNPGVGSIQTVLLAGTAAWVIVNVMGGKKKK